MKTKTPLHRIAALFALALLATFGATHEAKAQYQITTLGGSITETFTNYNGTAAPTTGNWVFNSNNTTGTKPGFGGQSNGNVNPGNVYSYGVASDSDRALGFLGSGSAGQNMNAFAEVQNNISSGTVTSLVVSWTGEMWRSVSTATSAITVAYAIGTKGVTSAATLGGLSWTNLNTYTPTQLANNQNGSLANSQSFNSGTVNLASFNNTQSIYIRVYYLGGGGTRAGLAIDDLSVTFNGAAASPGNFWAGVAGGGGSGIWTSTSTNWATGAGGAGRGGTQATSGALVFTNTAGTVDVGGPVTVNAGMQFATDGYTVRSNTITLAGADAAANTITTDTGVGTAINSVLAGSTGMTKAGSGTLLLAGNNTFTGALNVHDGTLEIASINNNSANGPLGNSTNPVSLGKSGTANVSTLHYTGGTASTTKGFSMASDATAGVINVANSGTTLTVSGQITGSSGSGLTKTGIGRLSLSGSSSYNGATTVSAGDLNLSGGSIASSAVTVASGASLSGYGSVGTIGGAGAINPGNSPGILTTPQVNPSGGTDFNFEMTGTAPTYSNAASSVNDLIRITGATPFSQALAGNGTNSINIYFSGGALFTGVPKTITGGFFTDQSTNLASSISGATYNYYFADAIGTNSYNGVNYYTKAQYETAVLSSNLMTITVTTVAQTANFGGGDINGQIMQVQVVPEPSTYALLGLSAAAFGAYRWRRRRRG